MDNERIVNRLMQEGESVSVWLKRLDGEKRQIQAVEKDPQVDPEVLKRPVKMGNKRKAGYVNVNQLMAETLGDNGIAVKVLAELYDRREPKVAGRSLLTVASPVRDMSRLKTVVEAVLSGMGSTSQAIVREVCPRDKKWRREYPGATEPFAELSGGMRGTVVDRVVVRLEPKVKEKLVAHPIGDIVYDLQAPVRERIREMVREKNDPFFTG